MKMFRQIILSWLNGVPREALTAKEVECKALRDNLESYKQFTERCYWYIGSYPAWKAQSEFRELLAELGHPIRMQDDINSSRAACVDSYLGQVVDACAAIREDVPNAKYGDDPDLWSEERLSEARGYGWIAKPEYNAS